MPRDQMCGGGDGYAMGELKRSNQGSQEDHKQTAVGQAERDGGRARAGWGLDVMMDEGTIVRPH